MTEPKRTPYSGEGTDIYFGEYTGVGEKDGMWRMRVVTEEMEAEVDFRREQLWDWIDTLGEALNDPTIRAYAQSQKRKGA